jgi:hypothetical protein
MALLSGQEFKLKMYFRALFGMILVTDGSLGETRQWRLEEYDR